MVKEPYAERPPRYEYRLTEKGRAFWDVLAAMWRWGGDWLWRKGGPPVMLVDRETRREVRPVVVDEDTGQRLDVRRLRAVARARRRPRQRRVTEVDACGDSAGSGPSAKPKASSRAASREAQPRPSRG